MNDLKACPFCGSEAKVRKRHTSRYVYATMYYVQCTGCGVKTTEELDTDAVARDKWNRRCPIKDNDTV